MKEYKYIITDPEGIHARPAGELVKLLKSYQSGITIGKDGKYVDAKRILGVMSLAVKQGQEITMTASGEDEEAAIAAIEAFLHETM